MDAQQIANLMTHLRAACALVSFPFDSLIASVLWGIEQNRNPFETSRRKYLSASPRRICLSPSFSSPPECLQNFPPSLPHPVSE
jgi:hypothetical protein